MPPKKAKKSKAEQEREEAEARALEEMMAREREAEEKQRIENDLRDKMEIKERELQARQKVVAEMAQKDQSIAELSQQVDRMHKEARSVKEEMAQEIQQMRETKEALDDELSNTTAELMNRISLMRNENEDLHDNLEKATAANERIEDENRALKEQLKNMEEGLKNELQSKTAELQETQRKAEEEASANRAKIAQLQSSLEQYSSNVTTLESALKGRAEDDQKNMSLIEALKSQMEMSHANFTRHLENESGRVGSMQEENTALQRKVNQLEVDLEEATKRMEVMKQEWHAEAAEWRTKVEKGEFDNKFLQRNLEVTEKRLKKATEELTKSEQQRKNTVEGQVMLEDEYPSGPVRDPVVRHLMDKHQELTTEARNLRLKFQESREQADQLEAMLKRRERDHLERAAQLSAQISQHRTTITQLQSRVAQEKEARLEAVAALTEEVDRTTNSLMMNRHEGDNQRMTMARLQARMQSEISTMRASIFELQGAVVAKEREIEDLKTEQARSHENYKRQLMEQELRHAKLLGQAQKGEQDVSTLLQERVQLAETELKRVHATSSEQEGQLQAQVASLTALVSDQTNEIRTTKSHYETTISQMRSENARLREVLAANFIPHTSTGIAAATA
jgi:chromosome segregation ATPase|mmetsp:Transcript_12577/g.22853  ORF Transcript_12577/g.22853 Transcript_12577/m.22853 type:complete len:624 (-) Transcript_12577:8-1879(-)